MKNFTFSEILLQWFHAQKRELPWRNDPSPYNILISEFILQQTRVNQGLGYYYKFIKHFPTLQHLGNASEEEVLSQWQGLGYYSRARNLLKTAKIILVDFNGKIPNEYNKLILLPGIGPYSAAAIASIAFKQPIAAVDGNVIRVISRIFGLMNETYTTNGKKEITNKTTELLDRENPGDYNQALMEFGAIQCTPKKPNCSVCVMSDFCIAYQSNMVNLLPTRKKKKQLLERFFYYIVIEVDGGIMLQKRTKKDIWENLYEFPLIESLHLIDLEKILISNIDSLYEFASFNYSKKNIQILSHQKLHIQFIHLKNMNIQVTYDFFDHFKLNFTNDKERKTELKNSAEELTIQISKEMILVKKELFHRYAVPIAIKKYVMRFCFVE
jgi:A/G-specific adenine glycosylase